MKNDGALIVQSAPVLFEDTPEENLSAFRFLLAEKSRAFSRAEGEDCFTGRPRPQPEVQLEPEGKSNSAEGAMAKRWKKIKWLLQRKNQSEREHLQQRTMVPQSAPKWHFSPIEFEATKSAETQSIGSRAE